MTVQLVCIGVVYAVFFCVVTSVTLTGNFNMLTRVGLGGPFTSVTLTGTFNMLTRVGLGGPFTSVTLTGIFNMLTRVGLRGPYPQKNCLLLMKYEHVAEVVVKFYSYATCLKGV